MVQDWSKLSNQEKIQVAKKQELRVEWMQQNPKRSESAQRYERYKTANTLKEAMSLGCRVADISWDLDRVS